MDIDEGDEFPITQISNPDTRINGNQGNTLNSLVEQGKIASERLRNLLYEHNKGIIIYCYQLSACSNQLCNTH